VTVGFPVKVVATILIAVWEELETVTMLDKLMEIACVRETVP
jgi:hypothetical protein